MLYLLARIHMYLFSVAGFMAVFNWALSHVLYGDSPESPTAKSSGQLSMLVMGLTFMAIGLVIAFLLGSHSDSNSGKVARKLKLVVDNTENK